MDAVRQIFDDYSAARGAALACPARVNCSHFSASIFSFVDRALNQLIPSGILNALTQTVIPDHATDVQRLKGDDSKRGNERVTELVNKVAAAVGDALVNAPRRAPIYFALRPRQRPLIRAEESRIGNLFAGRKRGEVGQADINSDRLSVLRQWLAFDFRAKAGEPLARRRARDGQRLDCAF